MARSFIGLISRGACVVLLAPLCVKAASGVSLALYNGGSPFFTPIYEGWIHRCGVLGITCYTTTPPDGESGEDCVENRRNQINEWYDMGVRGVALKPCSNEEEMGVLVEESAEKGMYISFFDRDIVNFMTSRIAYVGTDNEFMGRTMAKLLRQLRSEGGTYVMIGHKEQRMSGFREEIERYNHRDDRAHFYELEGPTEDYLWGWYQIENEFGNETTSDMFKNPPGNDFMPLMERAAELNPTAMIFMKQTPMNHNNYTDFVDKHRHRNILYIGTDGADYQLAYLNSRYVDGLVGQLPYEMGTESAQTLHDVLTNGVAAIKDEIVTTNIVAYNLIPIQLPELDVDENLIGNLKYIGYVCFGIVALSVIFCSIWTIRYRSELVVRAAQPFFLLMVASGCLIMAGSLIPLTFDDGGDLQPMSHRRSVGICMSVPWLAFIGFTVMFSALFSKLWRVNQLFHARTSFTRVKLREVDVLKPFMILLLLNIAVLTCWTVIDPLKYKREENEGTDYWNRVLSTYGACRSDNVFAYLVPLAVINFIVVVIACWQAVKARDLKSEFSEATYIGLAVGGLCQAFLTGLPVVAVVKDEPQAYFIVLTMVIFLVCEVTLLLIFLPKVRLRVQYSGMSDEEQKKMFEQRIRQQASMKKNSSVVGARASYEGSSAVVGDHESHEIMSVPPHFSGSSQKTVSDRLPSVDEVSEEHISDEDKSKSFAVDNVDISSQELEDSSRGTPDTHDETDPGESADAASSNPASESPRDGSGEDVTTDSASNSAS